MRPCTLLPCCLVAIACGSGSTPRASEDDTGVVTESSTVVSASDGSVGGSNDATTDGAADSSTGAPDCNGADPTGAPTAAEVCDGIDQDCDGEIDEGVPNDGAGCMDPGMPEPSEVVGIVTISVHTSTASNADSDSAFEACLGDGHCWPLDVKTTWNDRELDQWDVYALENVAIPRAELDRFEIRVATGSGDDRWKPDAFGVAFDGEPVYCRTGDPIFLGSMGGDEVASWIDPDGLANHCDTAWPAALTHGPMIGAVDPDGARIWYRTDATRAVRLRVAEAPEDLANAPIVHYGYPAASKDFADVAHVHGLAPESTWFFDLEIDGVRHGPWSFTTAPLPDAATSFRVAFGSCSRDNAQPIFATIREWAPDLFMFIGDNHYGNTNDIDALRQWYRWAHGRPGGRSELLHEASILAVWDDHDFTGNNLDGNAAGKENALRAFGEYWANPSYGTDELLGIFSRHRYGDVEIFLLDDRYWRGLDESITGDAQEAWLQTALVDSDATFKLVVSGSQYTLLDQSDSWGVFPAAQTRLRQFIADEGVEGVLLLSGDVHRAELRLLPGASGGYDLPELTSSPLANSAMGCDNGESDLISCFDGDDFFLGLEVDLSAADPTVTVHVIDVDGDERDVWAIPRSSLQ